MSYKYLVNIDSNDNLKESDILRFLTTPKHLNIPMNMVNVQQYNNTNIKISNNTFLVESDLLFRTNFILNCIISINHSISTKFIVTKPKNPSYYIHFSVPNHSKSDFVNILKQNLEDILKSDNKSIVSFVALFSKLDVSSSSRNVFHQSSNSDEVVVKFSYLFSDLSRSQIVDSLFIDSHIPSPFFLEFLDSPTSSSSQLFSAFIPSSIFSSLLNQTISKIEFVDGSFLIPSQLIPYQNKQVVLVPSSYSPFDFFIQNTTIGIMKSWVSSLSPLPQVGDKVQIFSGGAIISGSVSNQNPIQVELN